MTQIFDIFMVSFLTFISISLFFFMQQQKNILIKSYGKSLNVLCRNINLPHKDFGIEVEFLNISIGSSSLPDYLMNGTEPVGNKSFVQIINKSIVGEDIYCFIACCGNGQMSSIVH